MITGSRVLLLLGTHKGGFVLESDLKRERWAVRDRLFGGTDVNHLVLDTRGRPRLFAAVNSAWFGPQVQYSTDLSATWQQPAEGVKFKEGGERTVAKVWQLTPGPENQPGVLYAGVDPAALFRSDDGGEHWAEVPALAAHPSRDKWNPGAGGLMVHSIAPHPTDPARVHVGISAAGTFETRDGGSSWEPRNKDVLADFLPPPDQYPEVGQCVHHLERDPRDADVLYQQNHAGVYRSDDAGANWVDISEGLPSRFGFPMLVHPRERDTVYVVPEQGAEFRAAVDAKFAVFRSRDRGAHWERIDRGLPNTDSYLAVYRQAMTADPCETAGIYLGTSTGQVFGSLDAGNSWRLVATNLPPIYSLEAAVV